MADNMMRTGGRGEDGKAKAFRTNNQGDQYVQLTGSYVRQESEGLPSGGQEGNECIYWDTRRFFLHDGTQWRELTKNE